MSREDKVKDVLYPSDNVFDIPVLRLDGQAEALELPFAPANVRKSVCAKTIHYYIEDYRFATLWSDPAKILLAGVSQAVEPNFSLFDSTPVARGLCRVYKKRWISRFWQEHGIKVYVDLNVSAKFYDYNLLGVPEGYNAFATRGYRDRPEAVVCEYEMARRISGYDSPNMIVYGGGEEIHEFCMRHALLYVTDFMTEKDLHGKGLRCG